jgi:hypothetical protein
MLLLVLLTLALAQTPPAERPASPRANRPAGLTNGELVNMLDTYAIVQAQSALQLADSEYGAFVTRLKRLQQIRRQANRRHNQIVQELARLTQDPAADEVTLRARLKALQDQDVTAAEELRRAYESLDELLSPRQQARLRVFEERMERQKLDLLMRARNAAPAKAQPRRPDGS